MISRSPIVFGILAAALLLSSSASAQRREREKDKEKEKDDKTTVSPSTPAPGTAPAAADTSAAGATQGATSQGGLDPKEGAVGSQSTSTVDVSGTAGARAAGTPPPGAAEGRGFMDTRLTWTFGDDDFLHKTGELVPLSPTFSVGERPQYRLFFDNLNSRFAGRENLTHLVMYKKLPGFIEGLTTEAALVMRFDLAQLAANTGNLNAAIYDSGSYLRLFYATGGNEGKTGLGLTFFPLDTDRMRLGYLYDLSWGGTAAYINQSIFPRLQGSAPGAKIQYDHEKFYVYGGFKTATIIQPQQVLNPGGGSEVEAVRVGETNYGFMAGAGVDPLETLRFDVGAGFFQQGKFDLEDVRGKSVYTYGGSGRVLVHQNMPVPQSIDFLLYRNDPAKPLILFKPEKYDANQFAWNVSGELDVLRQQLKDFDTAGVTRDQTAMGGAIQGTVRAGYLRFSATGIYRNLNFVVRNVPGFIPFNTLPASSKTDPELFGAIATDYHIPSAHLTPGIGGGVQLPSTFRSEFTDGGVPAQRVIIVRQQGDQSILPYNKERTPILQARVSVRWDMSEMFALVGWLQFVRDNNGTLVVRDPSEGSASLRVFQSPNRVGAAVAVQARF
ncbi:MAG: hypothetical protein KIT84_25490 [Labilithrix sp.]|nr:hypothetical protein [Labilithrix sp.]MCW5814406.1 hypothetical protein [Labilithrix sp.]